MVVLLLFKIYEVFFYASWVFVSLQRWVTIFALSALFSFQAVLASMKIPGRREIRVFGLNIGVDRHEKLDWLLRKLTIGLILVYLPIFTFSVLSVLIKDSHIYLVNHVLYLVFFLGLLFFLNVYIKYTNHISNYYTHRRTNLLIIVITDIIAVLWISVFIVVNVIQPLTLEDYLLSSENYWIVTLLESCYHCFLIVLWILLYLTEVIFTLILALCGYPARRDEYETRIFQQANDYNSQLSRSISVKISRDLKEYIRTNTLSGEKLLSM
jgi:hypothetical protein